MRANSRRVLTPCLIAPVAQGTLEAAPGYWAELDGGGDAADGPRTSMPDSVCHSCSTARRSVDTWRRAITLAATRSVHQRCRLSCSACESQRGRKSACQPRFAGLQAARSQALVQPRQSALGVHTADCRTTGGQKDLSTVFSASFRPLKIFSGIFLSSFFLLQSVVPYCGL